MRFYKPIKPVSDVVLVLKAHGGGETRSVVPPNHGPLTAKHRLGRWRPWGEEVENRILAAHANAVVASVDYRTKPEYKFPYAVNDCFDASKWACSLSRGPSKVALGQS